MVVGGVFGGFEIKDIIFKCAVEITFMSISSVTAIKWMAQQLTDQKTALVQVMSWCRQANGIVD